MVTWHFAVCGLRFAVSHEKPDVKGLYSQILQEVPYYSGIHLFFSRDWKVEKVYENVSFEEGPATANSVLAFSNPQTFKAHPIHKILTWFTCITTLLQWYYIQVGSVSCECSFSALRRLKLWNRSTVTEERLSAMLRIQRETDYIRTVRGVTHFNTEYNKTGERDLATTRFFLTEFPA